MSFLIRHDPPVGNQDGNESRESFDEPIPEEHRSGRPDSETDNEPLPASSSSVIKFYPEWCTCFGGEAIQYPIGENATCVGLIRYIFQCPPFGPIAKITVFLFIFALAWTILYFLIGPTAGFNGPICTLIILEIVGLFLGMTMKIFGLPTLLAPLLFGIILRNVDTIDIFEYFKFPYTKKFCEISNISTCCQEFGTRASSHWITPIREIALALILTRAGTELSPKQLRKLKGIVPALAFIPCVTEALTAALLFYLCFPNLEPQFAICLVAGFSLAAVSPAVVVPGMLSLARRGYGVLKGIPTLLIAASSIDDVLAISMYSIALSLAIHSPIQGTPNKHKCQSPFVRKETKLEGITEGLEIAGGPLGILVGILYGIIVGCLLHFLPSRESKSKGNLRLILLLCCNICCMLGFSSTEFLAGAGSLGVLTTSFVASFGWRSQRHWKPSMHQVEVKLTHMWTLFVPILFGTIGKEMRFIRDKDDNYFTENDTKQLRNEIKEYHPFDVANVGRIIGIILICILVRCCVTFVIVGFAGLNRKERLFVALAWIPKATVQAALAPLVLTTIIEKEVTDVKLKTLAMNIVVMAVFGILMTAPFGAIMITFAGPRLLQKILPAEIEEEFPNGEPDPNEESEPDTYSRRGSRATTVSLQQSSSAFNFPTYPPSTSQMDASSYLVPDNQMDLAGNQNVADSLRFDSNTIDADVQRNRSADNPRNRTLSEVPRRVSQGRIGSKGDSGLPPDIPQ